MDRLNQLRGEAGGSRDSTLDTSTATSEAYVTADESSKYFSLSEEDSTFDISPIKDVSLASTADPEPITGSDQLISNISPNAKKNDLLDSYKFDKQIEAANILSGGVDIFDDNDNSYDGLVIDDNVGDIDDKSNTELKLSEGEVASIPKVEEIKPIIGEEVSEPVMGAEISDPAKGKEEALAIGEEISEPTVDQVVSRPTMGTEIPEPAMDQKVSEQAIGEEILESAIDEVILEPAIDEEMPEPAVVEVQGSKIAVEAQEPTIAVEVQEPANAVEVQEPSNAVEVQQPAIDRESSEPAMGEPGPMLVIVSKDTEEVVVQIDGNSFNAINIGNGVYLYRQEGEEELTAVQINSDNDQQQSSFKFLKVR